MQLQTAFWGCQSSAKGVAVLHSFSPPVQHRDLKAPCRSTSDWFVFFKGGMRWMIHRRPKGGPEISTTNWGDLYSLRT